MKKILVLMAFSNLFACTTKEQGNTMVMFLEKEKGVEPYQTRMIISKEFVRIDDGQDSNSFVLFDRVKKIVYSTNPDDNAIMAVHEKKMPENKKLEPPIKLVQTVKEVKDMQDAPEIGGQKPLHYQLSSNDKICSDVVAVKGLMPDVVKALSEFRTLMATDSASTFHNIPPELYDACNMSKSTFAPTRHLDFGFPIHQSDLDGYMRTLVNFQTDYKTDPKLFVLPEGFKRYTVKEFREGKVKIN